MEKKTPLSLLRMQELTIYLYCMMIFLCCCIMRMSGSHICTFVIIAGSGGFLLRDSSCVKCYYSNTGDIQPWYVPGMYYRVWLIKQLLKHIPSLSRSQSNNYLTSCFTRLNNDPQTVPGTLSFLLYVKGRDNTL